MSDQLSGQESLRPHFTEKRQMFKARVSIFLAVYILISAKEATAPVSSA